MSSKKQTRALFEELRLVEILTKVGRGFSMIRSYIVCVITGKRLFKGSRPLLSRCFLQFELKQNFFV